MKLFSELPNRHFLRDDFFFFFVWCECAGPGCSSLGVGAFSENGPFRPSGEVLVRNEYSWNRGILSSYPLKLSFLFFLFFLSSISG